jgi:hypothetical protein
MLKRELYYVLRTIGSIDLSLFQASGECTGFASISISISTYFSILPNGRFLAPDTDGATLKSNTAFPFFLFTVVFLNYAYRLAETPESRSILV